MASERGLFRWPGGKGHLVERLAPLLRRHATHRGGLTVSLFYGSGAIERAAGCVRLAADASPELLGLYDDLQQLGPAAVYAALLQFDAQTERTKDGYNLARSRFGLPAPLRSGRFLWLSAMAFNGIWRVNARAVMNMPPDPARLASKTTLPPRDAFDAFAEQLRDTRFVNGWRTAWMERRRTDLLFADPPYMGKGAFRSYTKDGFDDGAQRMLAQCLREHVDQGGALIAFNGPVAARLYEKWAHVEVSMRPGTVSSKGDEREEVGELLITAGLEIQERAA